MITEKMEKQNSHRRRDFTNLVIRVRQMIKFFKMKIIDATGTYVSSVVCWSMAYFFLVRLDAAISDTLLYYYPSVTNSKLIVEWLFVVLILPALFLTVVIFECHDKDQSFARTYKDIKTDIIDTGTTSPPTPLTPLASVIDIETCPPRRHFACL